MEHPRTAVDRFEQWLRHEFVELNTELEEAYFETRSEILHRPDLEVVIGGLARLSDLRAARDRPGVMVSARASLDKLREVIDVDRRRAVITG